MEAGAEADTVRITVVVPCLDASSPRLDGLCASLLGQTLQDFEVVLVADGSPPSRLPPLPDERFRLVRTGERCGPASARNVGAAMGRANLLFFTDSDCELSPRALEAAVSALDGDELVAGNTVTVWRTGFGRAVALLGFPGGGLIGFDRVWRVDVSGHTDSVSGCNFAIRREIFEGLGGFDPSFPVAGGEDTVLGRLAVSRGYAIRYAAGQVVYHPARESIRSFVAWQITRGRGCFHIGRRLPRVRELLGLRLWSLKNSLLAAGLLAPAVLLLFTLLVVLQSIGYKLEQARWCDA